MVNKKIYGKTHSIDGNTKLNNIKIMLLEQDIFESNMINISIIQKGTCYWKCMVVTRKIMNNLEI